MSVTFAHIAGVPLEEGLLALAPAASAIAVFVAVPLRRVGGCARRSLALRQTAVAAMRMRWNNRAPPR